MSDPLGEGLYNAADKVVSSLLRDHPEINVNWTDEHWTSLHTASFRGHLEVVKLLLAHPNVNVNLKNCDGQTPLSFGCEYGQVSVVRLLLKDPRVEVALDDIRGCTPLWWASCEGKYEVIEWLIASGRDLGDVRNKKGHWNENKFTAIEIARREGKTEVVDLFTG